MDFDLHSLVDIEQSFYDEGYKAGYAHGCIHGLIEGRAFGREKGFEMWEELGYYEGFALMWKETLKKKITNNDRAIHHISYLLDMVDQFPKVNPSAADSSELDIPKLFRQIRSRYKALCAALGTRPTLRATDLSSTQEEFPQSGESTQNTAQKDTKKKIWPTTISGSSSRGEDLSF